MKQLLSWGGSGLITAAALDLMFQSGLDRPLPWGRDLLLAGAGVFCIYLLVRYRRDL